MPDKTPCARCLKVGFVRFENVIRGGMAERHYYCGACNHSWAMTAEGDPEPTAKREQSDAAGKSLASDRHKKARTKAAQRHRDRGNH